MYLFKPQTKGLEIVYFLAILLSVLLYLDYKKFNDEKTSIKEKNERKKNSNRIVMVQVQQVAAVVVVVMMMILVI